MSDTTLIHIGSKASSCYCSQELFETYKRRLKTSNSFVICEDEVEFLVSINDVYPSPHLNERCIILLSTDMKGSVYTWNTVELTSPRILIGERKDSHVISTVTISTTETECFVVDDRLPSDVILKFQRICGYIMFNGHNIKATFEHHVRGPYYEKYPPDILVFKDHVRYFIELEIPQQLNEQELRYISEYFFNYLFQLVFGTLLQNRC